MIWELGTECVVMLCKVDKGYQGCSPYFPTEEGEKR